MNKQKVYNMIDAIAAQCPNRKSTGGIEICKITEKPCMRVIESGECTMLSKSNLSKSKN